MEGALGRAAEAYREIQNSVGREVREGSLKKSTFFLLCIREGFVLILY